MTPRFFVQASLILLLVSCQGASHKDSLASPAVTPKEPQRKFKLPSVWLHTDSEAPEMKLVLNPDGSFKFLGGYIFWSPGTWKFDSDSHELTLDLPKMNSKDFKYMLQQQARDKIIKSDLKSKRISYSIDPQDPSFIFQGYHFYPDPSVAQ